jgi:hypothetical protein
MLYISAFVTASIAVILLIAQTIRILFDLDLIMPSADLIVITLTSLVASNICTQIAKSS